MSAPSTPFRVRPATAIFPNRVMVLSEAEQHEIADALRSLDPETSAAAHRIFNRIYYGDEYTNAQDELTRRTLAKRVLEGEIRKHNRAIERCETEVIDDWVQRGDAGAKHKATGATLALDTKIWAKLDVDVDDLPKDRADEVKAEHKGKAGAALERAGLGAYVRPDFNFSSVSAHFRQLVKDYQEEQLALPEDERVPRTVQSFLPPELEGLIRLDDTPHIRVNAPRS